MPINRAPFNALVDDDGTGQVGTIWNKTAIKNVLLDPMDAALLVAGRAVQRTTLTGAQHDFALTYPGIDTMLICNNASLLTLDGIAGGVDGQQITIIAASQDVRVDLPYYSGSTPSNRFVNMAQSGVTSLVGPHGKAVYQYDAGIPFWRLITHEQGSWISVPYVASDFTGVGSMTWTVDAGDFFSPLLYRLTGRTLMVSFDFYQTSVGGSLNYALQLKIPGGFSGASGRSVTAGGCVASDNGVSVPGSYVSLGPAATVLQLIKPGAPSWVASTNNTRVQATAIFEVQ